MALSRLVTSDGFPLTTSDGSPIYVSDEGSVVRMTQLPILAAYDFETLRPFVEGTGSAWATPPPRCDD